MAVTNDDEKEEEEDEDEEPQFRELERMQSMTHEDIVEKIMQLRTTRRQSDSDDSDDVNDDVNDDDVKNFDDDFDDFDLTGFEGTKIAMVIAQGMRAHAARARLEEEIASRPKDWQPPPAHETFLRKLRRKIYRIGNKTRRLCKETWTSKRQEEREQKRAKRKEGGSGQESRYTREELY